jgi:hypothetical protein
MPSVAQSGTPNTGPGAVIRPWRIDYREAGAAADGRRERRRRAHAVGRQAGGGSESAAARQERTANGQSRTGSGLVICAKNVRDPVDGDGGAREPGAWDALGLWFPSPELVSAAASLFEQAQPWAAGRGRRGTEPESGRFRVTVGPGVVRLGWKNPVREERAAQRAADRRDRDVGDKEALVKELLESASRPNSHGAVHAAGCHWKAAGGPAHRRAINEWSRRSRTAMCRTFAEVDYTPLVSAGRVPAMVTLTYPGEWETVAPDGASVKRHMVLWRKRFHREYGEQARYIWKLEFQRRGAPHVHLWMAPPSKPGRSGSPFREWLSQTWADIVDHPDPTHRARHRTAGTAVDVLNGLRACDPKRLAIYFTKHSSPNTLGDKEYQHIVPEPWREPGKGPDRFWGMFGLKRATATAEIEKDAYLTARRIIRRWSRSQAAYGNVTSRYPTAVTPRTAYRLVKRVDRDTGRVRRRRVRRRRAICDQGGLAGGFALVNDGPAFAAQLARAVSG